LIQAFQAAEPWAFEKIYNRFSKPILRLVRARTASDAIAQELTQEIFLKAFRFRHRYQEPFAFSTWLWTIAKNTVKDFARSTALEMIGTSPAISSGAVVENNPEHFYAASSEKNDPEESLLRQEKLQRLHQSAQALPPKERRVFWLKMAFELTHPEIASRLNISVDSSKRLLRRALRHLQFVANSALAEGQVVGAEAY
jgi:RNA polymerase sigma-70 factor (ECF subfamily)